MIQNHLDLIIKSFIVVSAFKLYCIISLPKDLHIIFAESFLVVPFGPSTIIFIPFEI